MILERLPIISGSKGFSCVFTWVLHTSTWNALTEIFRPQITGFSGKHVDFQTICSRFHSQVQSSQASRAQTHSKKKSVVINYSSRTTSQNKYSNCYLNTAWKEIQCAWDGSHLSVPGVLKDSIPSVTFGLGNVTVIFPSIPSPLSEGREDKCYTSSVLF